MIRKQLYLEETQDQALKTRAKELGISEAELVRRALDAALHPKESTHLAAPRRAALMRLLDNAKRLSAEHRLPAGLRFDQSVLGGRLGRCPTGIWRGLAHILGAC